jgi:hypothetical protein
MKKFILPLAILGMGLLLGAAVVADCLRLAADARQRVHLADVEIVKHDIRLVRLLAGAPQVSPEVTAAIAQYASAKGVNARLAAYDAIVAGFQKTMAGNVDPDNPLDRKFMDDTAGAINRREIAEKLFDAEWAAYRKFLGSWKGKVARRFSSQSRADWQAE